MFVIRGNTAIFKCIVPSFVADYVFVVSWEDSVGNKYPKSPNENFGIIVDIILYILYSIWNRTFLEYNIPFFHPVFVMTNFEKSNNTLIYLNSRCIYSISLKSFTHRSL